MVQINTEGRTVVFRVPGDEVECLKYTRIRNVVYDCYPYYRPIKTTQLDIKSPVFEENQQKQGYT
jgi:hypothetical protein